MTKIDKYISANDLRELDADRWTVHVFVETFGEGKIPIKKALSWLRKADHKEELMSILTQRTDVTRAFLKAGANVNMKDVNGLSLIHHAAIIENKNVARLLIDAIKDVNVNLVNKMNKTTLHLAAKFSSESVVKKLLEKGADPTIKTDLGWTARDLALSKGKYKVARILKEAENKWKKKRPLRRNLPKGHFLVASFPLKRISGR